MATRASVLPMAGASEDRAATDWRAMALEFGRLLGFAFVASLTIGLLFTAAAVLLPGAATP